ncbi:hypothetical protein [Pyrodictium abyssi]|uniref:Uncharacterized protein n=1 Tax=Pyrodictium abyssi TaxID=54256 RepID=A0ABN6ZLB1_9CREN|nr:hypothetical protein PABY_05930 [Pyrodictium abyssi]
MIRLCGLSFERAVAELLRERLERLAVLDIISEGVMVDEDTIMEMDRVVKRALARRLDRELSRGN